MGADLTTGVKYVAHELPDAAKNIRETIRTESAALTQAVATHMHTEGGKAATKIEANINTKVGAAAKSIKSSIVKGGVLLLTAVTIIGAALILLDKYLAYKVQQQSLKDTLSSAGAGISGAATSAGAHAGAASQAPQSPGGGT